MWFKESRSRISQQKDLIMVCSTNEDLSLSVKNTNLLIPRHSKHKTNTFNFFRIWNILPYTVCKWIGWLIYTTVYPSVPHNGLGISLNCTFWMFPLINTLGLYHQLISSGTKTWTGASDRDKSKMCKAVDQGKQQVYLDKYPIK